ncbi:MAG: VanZ family protein [Bacteroidota bacterium]
MSNKHRFKRYYLWVYVFIILLGIVLPINTKESVINHTFILGIRLDYLIHIIIFSPWFLFYSSTYFKMNKFLWLFTGFGLAILLEGIQSMIPYRTFNTLDMLFNAAGILLGFVFSQLKVFKNEE